MLAYQFECIDRTLHNYMLWHVIKTLVPYLSKPFQDAKKEFIHVLFGTYKNSQPYIPVSWVRQRQQ
jgi:hypothetical protein